MARFRTVNVSLLAFSLLSLPMWAQKRQSLAPDDPELYSAFFFFVEDLSAWLESRGAAVPANRAKLMDSAARYLKIDVKELPRLTAISDSVASTMRQISLDARNYRSTEQNNHRNPDAAVLRQFAAKRQDAIQAGVDRLKRELPLSSWNGLHTHINAEHRAGIKTLSSNPATAKKSLP